MKRKELKDCLDSVMEYVKLYKFVSPMQVAAKFDTTRGDARRWLEKLTKQGKLRKTKRDAAIVCGYRVRQGKLVSYEYIR